MQLLILCSMLSTVVLAAATATTAEWPQWRGPYNTGMAAGDAPLQWDDQTNVRWKVEISGRGHSTPVSPATALPDDRRADREGNAAASGRPCRRGCRRGLEHRFEVLAVDRGTGRIAWQRTATVATPHEGYHRVYGSFASNSPVTDGARVFAFFGSRGLYAYDVMAHCSGRRTSASRCGWTWRSAKARR